MGGFCIPLLPTEGEVTYLRSEAGENLAGGGPHIYIYFFPLNLPFIEHLL